MDTPRVTQSDEPGYESHDPSLHGEEHVRLYRETDGRIGHMWNGREIVLLTMIGRKSGEARTIPILFTRNGDNFAIIAFYAGAPRHPAWYLNLRTNPKARVQVKAEVWDVVAETAVSPEREHFWRDAARNWPNYDVYTTRTDRVIPVVLLRRT